MDRYTFANHNESHKISNIELSQVKDGGQCVSVLYHSIPPKHRQIVYNNDHYVWGKVIPLFELSVVSSLSPYHLTCCLSFIEQNLCKGLL